MIANINAEPTHGGDDDIALVGIACVFPGADSAARFWQNIVAKKDCVGDPPPGWGAERYGEADGRASEPVYTTRGGYLGDLCRFQPSKYGVMPSSVEGAEPDQFLALRCASEALADAGVPGLPINREKTAVILGRGFTINRGHLTWMLHGFVIDEVVSLLGRLEPGRGEETLAALRDELKRNLPPFHAETVPGLTPCVLAGRIANRLDLKGPAYTLDAACSSILVAADHAMNELRSGRCDAAIVGGVQVSTPAMIHQLFCRLGAVSRSGKIAPFSAGADGTVLGEGCGMMVLKRRADAERDGNRIYALLKAVGVSSDGRGAGLLAPRTEGQQMAIRRAYEQAGLSPSTIGLIEAHGTGIAAGDRTEIASLAACFGSGGPDDRAIAIGTVKSMIGHLIPACGAASLIKTALALHHRTLPPTLHAEEPNPALGLDRTPFYLATEARPWIQGDRATPRRAGINAFGFGGINAHAILEEYRAPDGSAPGSLEGDWPAELVVVSAADAGSLRDRAVALGDWVARAGGVRLLDVAASCAAEVGPCRLAIVAEGLDDLARKLSHAARLLGQGDRERIQDRSGIFWYREPLAEAGRVAFLFPGEGAQYPDMLAALCRHFPEVRREFDLTDAAFRNTDAARPPSRLIFPPPGEVAEAEARLLGLEGAVASVLAAQRALLALLGRLGIRADAIVGHSSGEFGALLAAGAHAPADEEALIRSIADCAEGAARLTKSGLVPDAVLTRVGGADREAVARALEASGGRLVVAMDNCPHQMVLSGDEQATAAALEALRGQGGLCERLPWGRAYHTEAFGPASAIIEDYYRTLPLGSPRVELWSCASAGRFPEEPAAVLELAVRQWRRPVRFRETIEAMYEAGARIFVEVGPRGNLSAFVADTLAERPHAAIALDLIRRDGLEQLCRAVGMLAAHGVPMDLPALYRPRDPRRLDLAAEPPAAPAAEPVLDQASPGLTLGDEFAAGWRGSARRPEPAIANDAPGSTPRVAEVFLPPTDRFDFAGPEERPTIVRPPSPRLVVAEGSNEPSTVIADDARARALADFQRTMRLFLDGQERVTMAHYAAAKATGKAASPGPGVPDVPAHAGNGTGNGEAHAVAPSPGEHVARNGEAPSRTPAAPRTATTPPAIGPAMTRAEPQGASTPEARLLKIVSERTGYPVEMLDLEADLEADLGVDSIKRVEILSAFRRNILPAGVEPPTGLMERLAGSKTLRAILERMAEFADGPVPPAARWPFIEAVLVHEPGRRLLAECELDVDRHRFLLDHTFFGREISAHDPSLTALPVMPLAMTLELMAEAAATLRPGLAVVAVRDVRTMRWLAFEAPSRRVRLEATARPDGGVHVVVSEADREGMSAAIAEATVELADAEPDLGPPTVPDRATTPSPWAPDEVYGRVLFSGPAFRTIVEIDACDPHATRARLREPDPASLVPAGEARRPILPVALMDSCGQIAIFALAGTAWTEDEVHMTFPNRIERLEFLRDRGAGTLQAVARVEVDGPRVKSDAEMVDGAGRVVFRALGRVEELVRLPADLWAYWASPRRVHFSRDLTGLFGDIPGAGHLTVCEIGNAAGPLLVHRIWSRVLARMILGVEERQAFERLTIPPVPAASWLLGRAVAKDAVRLRTAFDACMADVAIAPDEHGRPAARLAGGAGEAPLVSVAHKEFAAVAAAADPGAFVGVGIDIEPLGPVDAGVREDAFGPGERAAIEAAARESGEPADAWFLAAWGAKEAVGKALGRGVLGGPRGVEVVDIDAGTGRMTLGLRGAMADAFPAYDTGHEPGPKIEAYRRVRVKHVITLCVLPRSAGGVR